MYGTGETHSTVSSLRSTARVTAAPQQTWPRSGWPPPRVGRRSASRRRRGPARGAGGPASEGPWMARSEASGQLGFGHEAEEPVLEGGGGARPFPGDDGPA